MKQVRWIIQDKNYAEADRLELLDACAANNLPCIPITVIPFSEALPDFPLDEHHENIYYGSTTLMNRIYQDLDKPLGLFYNEKTFSMANYIEKWGAHMLSSEAKVLPFEAFVTSTYPGDQKFFIRPDADSKSFNGTVMRFDAVKDWYERLLNNNVLEIGPTTKILVGPAYHIEKEWRNYIVNGKVVTSSLYMKNFQLHKSSTDIPPEMIAYVEARCGEYQPHDVFAMDIAKCSGAHEYYIIECGCMNSVGFYDCDIHAYVKSLTSYVREKLDQA